MKDDIGKRIAPIGFFDSGIGGLSIWRSVVRELPEESTVYLADSANCPYGGRGSEFVKERSIYCTEQLLSCGAKMIVVACNTATAAAIDYLRSHYDVPFVGLEPAIKPAAAEGKGKVVGVLATKGTLAGRHFQNTSSRLPADVRVVVRGIEGWVELVEAGETKPTDRVVSIVERELKPLLDESVESLVLGCTHFPFLKEAIESVVGASIKLYDPADAVARQVTNVLDKFDLVAPIDNKATHSLRSTLTDDDIVARARRLWSSEFGGDLWSPSWSEA